MFSAFSQLIRRVRRGIPTASVNGAGTFLHGFRASFITGRVPRAAIVAFNCRLIGVIHVADAIAGRFCRKLNFIHASSNFRRHFHPRRVDFHVARGCGQIMDYPYFFFLAVFFPERTNEHLIPFTATTFYRSVACTSFLILRDPMVLIEVGVDFTVFFGRVIQGHVGVLTARFRA